MIGQAGSAALRSRSIRRRVRTGRSLQSRSPRTTCAFRRATSAKRSSLLRKAVTVSAPLAFTQFVTTSSRASSNHVNRMSESTNASTVGGSRRSARCIVPNASITCSIAASWRSRSWRFRAAWSFSQKAITAVANAMSAAVNGGAVAAMKSIHCSGVTLGTLSGVS